MNGWRGKILNIALSAHRWTVESPDPRIYERHVGGRGLAGHCLQGSITRHWRDPQMPLLFFAGPLVGTAAPTSGRLTVMSRSPLTGTVGDASVGGRFGTELKRAGWDGIVITGVSSGLCGIEIRDGRVEFTDASGLKGLGVSDIHDRFKDKGATAAVGPAAENGVRFSAIVFDGHYAAGRGGLGLVFAAKNLKYITIKGTGAVPVADRRELAAAKDDILRLTAASPVLTGPLGITHFGTAALYDLTSSRRMMPTANFRKTHFEAAGRTNAHRYKTAYRPRKTGCRGCHIRCKKMDAEGVVLPEFETMNHFGPLLENADIEVVRRANSMCNDLGMDTISAGATLACHAEIEQQPLAGDRVLSLLTSMATARGIGRELGQGSYRFACSRGMPWTSVAVKGLELPAYDPRGAYGMALAYAVSTRGGCHLRAYPIGSEILRKPVPTDRFTFGGKARIVKIAEDLNAVIDSLSACKFIFFAVTMEEYARAYCAVTGLETSGQDLLRAGERIYYAERMMNARNGFDASDDDLPRRFFEEAGSSGSGIDVKPIDRRRFLAARADYYRMRGLDRKGRPTEKMAAVLGLPWEA